VGVEDGQKKGSKLDSGDFALRKVRSFRSWRRLTRNKISGEKIRIGRCRFRFRGKLGCLEELTNVRRKGLTFARLMVAIFGNAMSLLLTADSIVQSTLVGGSNANDKTVEKL
jgi:hypothetical protein